MEKLLSIKEKLKSVNSLILNLENANISLIEKDILLAEIREVYVLISALRSDAKLDNTQLVSKTVVEEKKIEPQVVKELISVSEPEVIEFVEPVVVEPKVEVKPEPVVQENIRVEAPQQQKLFGNAQANGNSNVKTVGEKLGQNKTSLNERLAGQSKSNDVASRISQKPITDIKAAIGIGDRFLYIRELFNGDNEVFEQTISELNSLNSFDVADLYLKEKFDWDDSQETVVNFVSVVKRKYL